MAAFNLLGSPPSARRSVRARLEAKEDNRRIALEFGEAYFDGPRAQGYGGYHYDGRWQTVAERAADRFGLKAGMRVLDIGCAKGFFVHDLMQAVPGLEACGLDISAYALEHAHPGLEGRLQQGSADALPFPDDSFDAVFAINTLHNLPPDACVTALKEIMRVVIDPSKAFVQVDAYRNETEKTLFEAWMLTAKTYCRPEEWHSLFKRAGYIGDHYWTILEFEDAQELLGTKPASS